MMTMLRFQLTLLTRATLLSVLAPRMKKKAIAPQMSSMTIAPAIIRTGLTLAGAAARVVAADFAAKPNGEPQFLHFVLVAGLSVPQ